jgi:hypothetical protein
MSCWDNEDDRIAELNMMALICMQIMIAASLHTFASSHRLLLMVMVGASSWIRQR